MDSRNIKYPKLHFEAAFSTTQSLIDVEEYCKNELITHSRPYIQTWEYGFYFVSLFITKTTIEKSYMVIASLFTEAHSAIRASFLLNNMGYHSDSIALLRKTHESVVRAIAVKFRPDITWNIVQEKSISKLENRYIKINLNAVYKVESSFTHSNQMKTMKAGMDLKAGVDPLGISYGPQLDDKLFSYSAKLSIFWLYVMIQSIPKLFPNQIPAHWLTNQDESAAYLHNYLVIHKSSLAQDCKDVDKVIGKIV